jgi:hypothetical protein
MRRQTVLSPPPVMAKKKFNRRYDRRPTKAEVLKAREFMAGPKGPGDYKTVEVVVADVVKVLRECEAVVMTVCDALKTDPTTESINAEVTLRVGCTNVMFDQIARLEKIIESTKEPHQPRLIVRDVRVPS